MLETLGKIAGIGGISLGVFLILFRDIIRKNIFPRFKNEELAYRLLRLIVVFVWSVALSGIAAWTFISLSEDKTSIIIEGNTYYYTNVEVILSQYNQLEGGQLIDQELKNKIERAVNLIESGRYIEALPVFEELSHEVQLPGFENNKGVLYAATRKHAKSIDSFKRVLRLDPSNKQAKNNLETIATKEPPPIIEPGSNSSDAVTYSSSVISSITVSPLTRQGLPSIEKIYTVEPGTNPLVSFAPVQVAETFGKPMIVKPGTYDIILKPAVGVRFTLIANVELKDKQSAEVDPNVVVSYISVSPLTLEDFPPLKEVFLVAAGTDQESTIYPLQSTENFGVPMFVKPGRYDIVCKPKEGRRFTLARGVDVKTGQGVAVDANRKAAAFICSDPGIPGLNLESIWVVKAGTPLQGYIAVSQKSDDFGKPMMVYAGDFYDIVLQPVDGVPMKIAENVSPKAGRITYIP